VRSIASWGAILGLFGFIPTLWVGVILFSAGLGGLLFVPDPLDVFLLMFGSFLLWVAHKRSNVKRITRRKRKK